MVTKKCGCDTVSTSICDECEEDPCACAPNCSPFYSSASACAEDHCKTVYKNAYMAAVKVENSFNMPGCDESAALQINYLKGIPLGSLLWAQGVGFLRVISVQINTNSAIVTVQNDCEEGNAAAGTQVPACTLFTVNAPQGGSGGGSPTGIFVAIDFTAPAEGDCLLITVTGVAGLQVNKNVGIGSGTYRIDEIPDATHIRICNDGDGLAEGTSVIAKDGAGEYQYPLVNIDANPCSNTGVAQGFIIVCDNGVMKPLGVLDSVPIGSIPIAIDNDGKVEFQFLDVQTRTCATISCCLTIVNGFAGPYIIPVSSSADFTVGDVLQIGTRTDRVTVTVIDDATTIRGTISPVPSATVDIAPATSICIIDCCEDLQTQVNALDTRLDTAETDINNIEADVADLDTRIDEYDDNNQATPIYAQEEDVTPATTVTGTPYLSPTLTPVVVVNNNTTANMLFFLSFLGRAYGSVDEKPGTFEFKLGYQINFSGPGAPVDIDKSGGNGFGQRMSWSEPVDPGTARPHDWYMTIPEIVVLPAGVTMTIENVSVEITRTAGASIAYAVEYASVEVWGAGHSN